MSGTVTLEQPVVHVAVDAEAPAVVVQPQTFSTIITDVGGTGPQGPIGPPGPAGAATTAVENTWLSSGATSALRAVRAQDATHIEYASPTNASGVLGITRTAVGAAESSVVVVEFGELSDGSWSWTPGPVFVGTNGALTQTPPLSGVVFQIAEAVASNRIVVSPRLRVARA